MFFLRRVFAEGDWRQREDYRHNCIELCCEGVLDHLSSSQRISVYLLLNLIKILVRTVIRTPALTLQDDFLEQISNLLVTVFGVYSLHIRYSSLSALV